MICYSTCLELFDPPPEDTTCAAAFSWHILALATFSLSSLSFSSLSWTTFSAVFTQALPRWRQSLAIATVVSLAPEWSVLSIAFPNVLSASAPCSNLPGWTVKVGSLREECDWRAARWSALQANWPMALGSLGVELRSGEGVAGVEYRGLSWRWVSYGWRRSCHVRPEWRWLGWPEQRCLVCLGKEISCMARDGDVLCGRRSLLTPIWADDIQPYLHSHIYWPCGSLR